MSKIKIFFFNIVLIVAPTSVENFLEIGVSVRKITQTPRFFFLSHITPHSRCARGVINLLREASLRPPVLEAGQIDKNKCFIQKRKIFLQKTQSSSFYSNNIEFLHLSPKNERIVNVFHYSFINVIVFGL